MMATVKLLCMQRSEIGPHIVPRGKSHGFPYFRQEPGVYLQEKAGALQNSYLFRDVSTTA